MNALTRLIIAIYILAGAPAFVFNRASYDTFSGFLGWDLLFGSIVAVPVLLIAWVAAGLRQRP
jgi:hypothetical protein